MTDNGPEKQIGEKAPLAVPPATERREPFPWPWGVIAVGVMALAWVGIYLIWNGIVFLLNL